MDSIVLHCLKSLNSERSIYSIYHLLKGKKTSQTIQDAHLFQLTHYFGAFPLITRKDLEHLINHLFEHQWIVPCEDHRFRLTKIGEEHLFHLKNRYPTLIYLNGLKYHQKDKRFWERLSLLIQVISNLVHKETNYIPIQKNKETHIWLKSFLNKTKLERKIFGESLYEEVVDCFQMERNLNPSILIFRLTGYNRIGHTSQQTAEMLKVEYVQYHLEFLNILHYLINQISTNRNRFPLMYAILEHSKQNIAMTNSASRTYEMLKMGYSIEKIAKYRRLRTNTIEDHIVEIALNVTDFPIDNFVDRQKQKSIVTAAKQTASKQLKRIKDEVGSANYFEIRLVLAKQGAE